MRVFAIAHEGHTLPQLGEMVEDILWIELGQAAQMLSFFQERGLKEAVMAGFITKANMFSRFSPDQRVLSIMARLKDFNDDNILRALADEFEKEGVKILPSTFFTPQIVAPPGTLTKRVPSPEEEIDIEFGWKMAKGIGRLDIGQCVVVRNRSVLAVEAIEGTDETIKRGGKLAGEKAVVVKVIKPSQDLRFDVPAIGHRTIEVMAEVKASVLAVEAGNTLIFNREELIRLADEHGIAVVARESE